MTCPNCKRPNSDEAVYCNNCGTRLGDQAIPRKGVKCPAGKHTMDPGWKTCPYCESAASPSSERAAGQEAVDLGQTKISSGDPGGLAKTKVMPGYEPAGSPQSSRVAGNNARIVGALVTYDWNKQGDLYPITEGKNYIGSGRSNDGALCDVCISQDPEMSREHALILYVRGEGTLYDQKSTNGTWMEKKLVKEEPLGRSASFRTGRTTWHFVSFELAAAAAGHTESARPEPPKEDSPRTLI